MGTCGKGAPEREWPPQGWSRKGLHWEKDSALGHVFPGRCPASCPCSPEGPQEDPHMHVGAGSGRNTEERLLGQRPKGGLGRSEKEGRARPAFPGRVTPARQAQPHLCACRPAGSAVTVREGVTGGSPAPSDVTAPRRAQLPGAEPSGGARARRAGPWVGGGGCAVPLQGDRREGAAVLELTFLLFFNGFFFFFKITLPFHFHCTPLSPQSPITYFWLPFPFPRVSLGVSSAHCPFPPLLVAPLSFPTCTGKSVFR